ncbi:hypothetical protein L9F63_017902, partial [Diploptera punctata]
GRNFTTDRGLKSNKGNQWAEMHISGESGERFCDFIANNCILIGEQTSGIFETLALNSYGVKWQQRAQLLLY